MKIDSKKTADAITAIENFIFNLLEGRSLPESIQGAFTHLREVTEQQAVPEAPNAAPHA